LRTSFRQRKRVSPRSKANGCHGRFSADGAGAQVDQKIAGIYRREPRGKARKAGDGAAGHSQKAAPPPASPPPPPVKDPLPAPEKLPAPIPDGLRVLIETLFRPGEGICIGKGSLNEKGDLDILDRNSAIRTWDRWQVYFQKRSLEQMNEKGEGLFFRINPMKPAGNSDADVTDMRYAVAEFDKDDSNCIIPKELQYAMFLRSKLPIAALIDGGGKSLHAIFRINAPDRAEYDCRFTLVLSRIPWLDGQNKNPSHYSRLPGVSRKSGRQLLLAINIGALDWLAWEEEIREETSEEVVEDILRPPWPVIDPAAYYGPLGDIAEDIEPETEADPTGVLLQLLMMFGCSIGRRPFYPRRRLRSRAVSQQVRALSMLFMMTS
jgi:hypothetical protein